MIQNRTALILLVFSLFGAKAMAQCVIDTLVPQSTGNYPDSLLPAPGCEFYESTITFILPRDTTVKVGPTPLYVPFNYFRFDSVSGLPKGMSWTCDKVPDCTYIVHPDSVNPDTIGCLRIFGTPQIPAVYYIQVHLTVNLKIFGNNQNEPGIINRTLTVLPCQIQGACYNYVLSSNCEGAELVIDNKIHSNGIAGYSYSWDFSGPGGLSLQSTSEDPYPLTLKEPGEYIIQYEGRIDTTQPVLKNAIITSVGCSDPVDAGDIYWILIAPDTTEIVNTSSNPLTNQGNNLPIVTNVPVTLLDSGTYEFQVWDNDTFDPDDGCATGASGSGASVFFTVPLSSPGPLTVTVNSLTVVFDIEQPVQVFTCSDTFRLDSLPMLPQLVADTTVVCGGDTASLWVTTTDSIVWFYNGNPIPGAQGNGLEVVEAGVYEVEVYDRNSLCRARSSSVEIEVLVTDVPGIAFDGVNKLTISNPQLGIIYNWYEKNLGFLSTGNTLIATQSGKYFATATDVTSGCESQASALVDLTITAIDPLAGIVSGLLLFPNPGNGRFTLEFELSKPGSFALEVISASGQIVQSQEWQLRTGAVSRIVQLRDPVPGLYLIRLRSEEGTVLRKLIVR